MSWANSISGVVVDWDGVVNWNGAVDWNGVVDWVGVVVLSIGGS